MDGSTNKKVMAETEHHDLRLKMFLFEQENWENQNQ